MNTFEKKAGRLEIYVCPPGSRRIEIKVCRSDGFILGSIYISGKDELLDLKYIVDRALDFIDEKGE